MSYAAPVRALWLLPLALVACSDGGREASPSPQAFPSSSSVSATPSPTSLPIATETADVHFRTPSGNIGCYLEAGEFGVQCDVAEHTWSLPSRPADCDGDWSAVASVGATGPATMGDCVSDSRLGAERVLAYRTGVRVGDIQCVSETTGLTCTNVATGRGFFVSRERYRLF